MARHTRGGQCVDFKLRQGLAHAWVELSTYRRGPHAPRLPSPRAWQARGGCRPCSDMRFRKLLGRHAHRWQTVRVAAVADATRAGMTWYVVSCGLYAGDPRPTRSDGDVLLDTSAALIDNIPAELHDALGVHVRPCARAFIGANAVETNGFIHRDDFNADAPASRSRVD